MPRVVIAGCGYVGQIAADLFHRAGWDVEGWTAAQSSADQLAHKPYPVRACDITDRAALPRKHGSPDVLIQCVSSHGGAEEDYRRVYLAGAENLVRAFPGTRLIFISSTSVYAQRAGEWVTEERPAEPTRATARILRETEKLVLEAGGIVARVGGIYGPSRSFLLQSFLDAKAVVDIANERFINQVHRDDIAAALFLLADRSSLGGQIFNVVDDRPMLVHDCYAWLASHFNRPFPPLGVRSATGKRGNSHKRVSNAKLRALDWQLRFPTFEAGMAESVIPSWKM